jgi:hypothetical protein
VPAATALSTDQATLKSLHHRGLHEVGFTATVLAVKAIETAPTEATLRVTDRLSSYSLVDRDGRVVQAGAARSTRTYLMTLTDTSNGWRVERIAASG